MTCTTETEYLDLSTVPGIAGYWLPGEYFDANGTLCAVGVACARMGTVLPAVQTTLANRPLVQVAPISGIPSPLFGTSKWMEIMGAAFLLAKGQPFSIVALVEPINDTGTSVVVAACNDSTSQYRECRADLQSGIRLVKKGSVATSVVSRTGMNPPTGGPYLVAFCDSGTKIVAYQEDGVTPIYGTLGHISRHGARVQLDRRTDITTQGLDIGDLVPNRLLIGGSMEGSATVVGPMEAHFLGAAIVVDDLSESMEYEIGRTLAAHANEIAGSEVVPLTEFRTRYVSAVSGSDNNDGLFADSALARPSVAQSYLAYDPAPATILTEAPTWALAFRSSLRWSPACENITVRPYSGQRYSYWNPTADIVTSWQAMGGGIYRTALDRSEANTPGTPGTVGFRGLHGPSGAKYRLLRKVPAVAYQGVLVSAAGTAFNLGADAYAAGVQAGMFVSILNNKIRITSIDPGTGNAVMASAIVPDPPAGTGYSVSFNAIQQTPPVDNFGFDTDPIDPAFPMVCYLYVHLPNGVNPALYLPFVDIRAYAICNFGAEMMTLAGQVAMGAGTACFSAGDSTTSPNQLQGAWVKRFDCHSLLNGTGSAGGSRIGGKAGGMESEECSDGFSSNDGGNGHRAKGSLFPARYIATNCYFFCTQDEPVSFHDGCEGIFDQCDFWGGGGGATTSVYEPGIDALRTTIRFRGCRWWDNARLNGGQYPGGGFSNDSPGILEYIGCEGDAYPTAPAGADVSAAGFTLRPTSSFVPRFVPEYEPLP